MFIRLRNRERSKHLSFRPQSFIIQTNGNVDVDVIAEEEAFERIGAEHIKGT